MAWPRLLLGEGVQSEYIRADIFSIVVPDQTVTSQDCVKAQRKECQQVQFVSVLMLRLEDRGDKRTIGEGGSLGFMLSPCCGKHGKFRHECASAHLHQVSRFLRVYSVPGDLQSRAAALLNTFTIYYNKHRTACHSLRGSCVRLA